MAREIIWRDLLTLLHYRNQEVFLNNALGLTQTPGVLSSVMLSLLLPNSGYCTAVQDQPDEEVPLFGQMVAPTSKNAAHLAFITPGDGIPAGALGKLLSFFSHQAGEKGCVQIRAEVGQRSGMVESFRAAGFQPYAEQCVWHIPRDMKAAADDVPWSPLSKRDTLKAESLYNDIVPRNVRRVEPRPLEDNQQRIACWEGEKLLGFTTLHWGPQGVMVDVFLDPAQSAMERHVRGIYQNLAPYHRRHFYFRVRSYQEKLASALDRLGAEPGPAQLAMVKYLAVHYRARQKHRLAALNKQPDITTPYMKSKAHQTTYE